MLVISISMATAGNRYILYVKAARSQLFFNQTAAVTLPSSRLPPMIKMGTTAPEKIAASPVIL